VYAPLQEPGMLWMTLIVLAIALAIAGTISSRD
jgi:hypothetical protein